MISSQVKKSSLNAVFWSFIERFSHQFLQFIFSIFLARLLLPQEFGLIALTSVFVAVGNSFINAGFSQALIQKKDANIIDESSIFYFNICVAFLVSALMIAFSKPIAEFYNEPILSNIIRVLTLSLVFNSLGVIQRTLLTKGLDFKTQMKARVITSVLAGSIGTYMAMKGYGVWSLAVLFVLTDFFDTLILWIVCPWRPQVTFSLSSLKSMFGFGSRLFIVSVTNAIFKNIYVVLIGRTFSPSILGFYNRAESFYRYPVVLINSVIGQVSFPVFAKIQDDQVTLKYLLSSGVKLVSFITFPLMFGLMVVAKPLIIILLTEKWLPAVLYLKLFCLVGVLYPIQALNLNALNALGRSDLYLKVDILNKLVILLTLFVSYRYGIVSIIIGQIFNSIVALILYTFFIGRFLGYSIVNQLRDIAPILLTSLIMAGAVYLLGNILIMNLNLLVLFQVTVGILVYFGLSYLYKSEVLFKMLEFPRKNSFGNEDQD